MPNYKVAGSGTSVRADDGQIVWLGGGAPLPGYVTGAQLAELVANARVYDDVEDAPDPGGDVAATVSPALNNLKGWTSDPGATANVTPTSGKLYTLRWIAPRTETISTLWIAIGTVATVGLATGNVLGIYSAAGVLLATTADQTANWTTVGAKSNALLTPQAVTRGTTYLMAAMTTVSSGTPPLLRGVAANAAAINANVTNAEGYRSGSYTGVGTTLPASLTLLSASSEGNTIWTGLS